MRQGTLYRQEKSALKGQYWKRYHAILKDEYLLLYEDSNSSSNTFQSSSNHDNNSFNAHSTTNSSGGSVLNSKAKHMICVEHRPVAEGYENFSRRDFTFKIHQKDSTRDKFVFLACDSEDEMIGWINMLLVHGAIRVEPVNLEQLYASDMCKHLQTETWDLDALSAHRSVMKQHFAHHLHKDYHYVHSGVVFVMTDARKGVYKPYMAILDDQYRLTFFTKKCHLSGLFLTRQCVLTLHESSSSSSSSSLSPSSLSPNGNSNSQVKSRRRDFEHLIVDGNLPVYQNLIKYPFDVIVESLSPSNSSGGGSGSGSKNSNSNSNSSSSSGEANAKKRIRLQCFVATRDEWEKWRDELQKSASHVEVCQAEKTRPDTIKGHQIMDSLFMNISEEYVKDTSKIALGRGVICADYEAHSGLEVSVTTGTIVDILEMRKDGLALVRLLDRSQGLIPRECVQEKTAPKTTAIQRFTRKNVNKKMPKRVNRSETIFKLQHVETIHHTESLTNVTHEKVDSLRSAPPDNRYGALPTTSYPYQNQSQNQNNHATSVYTKPPTPVLMTPPTVANRDAVPPPVPPPKRTAPTNYGYSDFEPTDLNVDSPMEEAPPMPPARTIASNQPMPPPRTFSPQQPALISPQEPTPPPRVTRVQETAAEPETTTPPIPVVLPPTRSQKPAPPQTPETVMLPPPLPSDQPTPPPRRPFQSPPPPMISSQEEERSSQPSTPTIAPKAVEPPQSPPPTPQRTVAPPIPVTRPPVLPPQSPPPQEKLSPRTSPTPPVVSSPPVPQKRQQAATATVTPPPRPSTPKPSPQLSSKSSPSDPTSVDIPKRNPKDPLNTVKKAGMQRRGTRRLPSNRESVTLLKMIEDDQQRNSMQAIKECSTSPPPMTPPRTQATTSHAPPDHRPPVTATGAIPLHRSPIATGAARQPPLIIDQLPKLKKVGAPKPRNPVPEVPTMDSELEMRMKRRQEQIKKLEEKQEKGASTSPNLEQEKMENEEKERQIQLAREQERKLQEQKQKEAEEAELKRQEEEEKRRREQEELKRQEEERKQREKEQREKEQREKERREMEQREKEQQEKEQREKEQHEKEQREKEEREREEQRRLEEEEQERIRQLEQEQNSQKEQQDNDISSTPTTETEEDTKTAAAKMIKIFVQNAEGRKKAMSVPSQSTLFEISQQAKIQAVFGLPKEQISVFIVHADGPEETLIDTRICDIGSCTLLFDKVNEDDWL